MKQLIWVGLMMVVLTACTSRFDGFDPATATVRWIIQQGYDAKQNSTK